MKLLLKKLVVITLTWEAKLVLKKFKPRIIAITGSVGKTSTKDAIYAVLAKNFHVRKSEKSLNSEIGLPLSILGLPNGWNNPFVWVSNIIRGFFLVFTISCKLSTKNYPEWLVLEIGADRPGDIEKVSEWLSPDIVVITRFGKVPVHVEFFKSPEDVIKEKCFLVKALRSDGLLLLNNDDADVRAIRDMRRDCQVATWSIDHESDFQASNFAINYAKLNGAAKPVGITFKINHAGNSVPIHLFGTIGRQQIYPVLAAIATGNALGLNLVDMADYIQKYETAPGRMRIIDGVKNTTIIDDTYNASPVALAATLETLGQIKIGDSNPSTQQGCAPNGASEPHGRKIAILGDMLELGKHTVNEHQKAGKQAKENCDVLVTVGIRARDIAEGALDNGMDEINIFQFDSSTEAAKPIEQLIKEGDIILIKGSQGIRMEKIVEEIMAHPEDKEKLLVRQEREWEKR